MMPRILTHASILRPTISPDILDGGSRGAWQLMRNIVSAAPFLPLAFLTILLLMIATCTNYDFPIHVSVNVQSQVRSDIATSAKEAEEAKEGMPSWKQDLLPGQKVSHQRTIESYPILQHAVIPV
jgi:hypothetical protein